MELGDLVASAEAAVRADVTTAHALEQSAQEIDSAAVARPTAAGLGEPDGHHPLPEVVRDRRARPPGRRPTDLVGTAMSTGPAFVEGVAQDVPDAVGFEPRFTSEPFDADVAEGIALEEPNCRTDRVGVDLVGAGRSGGSAEAEWRQTTLVGMAFELGAITVSDPLCEPPGIAFRSCGLGDELIPVMGIGAQDAPVAHHESDA